MKKINLKCTFRFCILFTGILFAQKNVTGTVMMRMEFRSRCYAVVLETNEGVSTDFDENYSISAEEGQTLQFSFVGYQSMDQQVGESSIVNISMSAGNALDEVVVTSLGIPDRKGHFPTQLRMLKQKVSMNQSKWKPCKFSKVRLRVYLLQQLVKVLTHNQELYLEVIDLSLYSQPLYIVDSVPLSGDIQDFSPDDIASVAFLKEVAAALYGARAQNGAIIITTKLVKKIHLMLM